jgi:peptidoglycan hydrolase CwlO-like protein
MRRKVALLVSGAVTAFVLILVIGLASATGWSDTAAQAAAPTPLAAPTAVNDVVMSGSSTAEVEKLRAEAANAKAQLEALQTEAANNKAQMETLQTEVATYKTELESAYQDLQTAYDQISQLQNALTQRGRNRGDRNGFNGSDD